MIESWSRWGKMWSLVLESILTCACCSQGGAVVSWRDGSKCVSCCCEDVSHVSHAESFYLGQEELLKPCSGLWNPAWNSPRALSWKCSLPVTPVAAHRVSGDHWRLWSFPLRNTGLGEGIAKWFLSYITQNLLHYLLWHIVSSHRVLLNRFQEEATP